MGAEAAGPGWGQPIEEPGEVTDVGLDELSGDADPALLEQLAAELAAIAEAEDTAYRETRHFRLGALPSSQVVARVQNGPSQAEYVR